MSEGIVPGRGDIELGPLLTKIHDLFDDVIIIMEVDMKNPVKSGKWNRTKRRNRVYKAINTGLKERNEIK